MRRVRISLRNALLLISCFCAFFSFLAIEIAARRKHVAAHERLQEIGAKITECGYTDPFGPNWIWLESADCRNSLLPWKLQCLVHRHLSTRVERGYEFSRNGCPFTAEVPMLLKRLLSLERLEFYQSQLTPEQIETLPPTVETVLICDCVLTPGTVTTLARLKALSSLKSLEHLGIQDWSLTDDFLKQLKDDFFPYTNVYNPHWNWID
jgi:hypothetical protein